MRKKSIFGNTLLYTIKTIMSMLFPLITFPYISRVLSPEGLGEYNFSVSVVSYLSLFAGLGISTYAIREGSKIREEKAKFQSFARDIFSFNVLSTIFAFGLFIIIIFVVPKLKSDICLLLILSTSVPLCCLGTEWLFIIYEDYLYITIRSLFVHFVSIIGMFIFVKTSDDVYNYALVTVFASAGSSLFGMIYAKRYIEHKININRSLKQYFKPIIILFAAIVASQIYINSDVIMLGFIKNDYDVGIYSASSKIYNIIRSLLAAFVSVLLPRMSFLFNTNKEKYKREICMYIEIYTGVIIPAAIGTFCVAEYLIHIICGGEYLSASSSLRILSIGLVFSTLGSFLANEVLVVSQKERLILIATTIGAITNVIGNIFLIPSYSYVAASITTLLSEVLVFSIQLYSASRVVEMKNAIKSIIIVLISCIPMVIITFVVEKCFFSFWEKFIIIVFGGAISYTCIIALLRHPIIKLFTEYIAKRKRIK